MNALSKHPLTALLALLFISIFSLTAVAKSPSTLDSEVEKLIQETLPNASIGILLQDANSGKILYERHSEEAFPPASTTKLFTALAAYLSLKPDYRYKTEVGVVANTLKAGRLPGNLYVKFSGDPTLTSADLEQLIKTLKAAGLSQIQGNIIIDASRFSGANYGLGWSHDSLSWYFAPPITSVILNENKAKIFLDANKPLGEKVEVTFAADEPLKFPLEQDVITVTESDAKDKCQVQVDMNSENVLAIKGCWPQDKNPNAVQVAIQNPTLVAKKIILETLKSENIQLDGTVIVKWSANNPANLNIPKDLTILATHASKPLNALLEPLLLDSNNIYAESLTKTLGYEKYQMGTFQMGVVAIKESLKSTGVNFSKLKIMDGSGGSRYNLIPPRQLGQLLLALYQDKTLRADIIPDLPVFGESGTLKSRTLETIKSKVRAKTGSMTGVSTLAGYLYPTAGKEMIFVIMTDHLLEKDTIRDFENKLCQLFLLNALEPNIPAGSDATQGEASATTAPKE